MLPLDGAASTDTNDIFLRGYSAWSGMLGRVLRASTIDGGAAAASAVRAVTEVRANYAASKVRRARGVSAPLRSLNLNCCGGTARCSPGMGQMNIKILFMGLPGAGKAALGSALDPLVNAVVFNADAVRTNLSRARLLRFGHKW